MNPATATAPTEIERRTIARIFPRLMPLLMFCYILAYVDRINIGFAALTMNKALGLDAYHYGLGAGLFFWGYFLFEVPSNLLLQKFGARRWITRIMITWGILSMAMAWVTGTTSFIVVRFMLGIAEAGFFPGILLYLTYWFPAAWRSRIIAAFMIAIPASVAVGSPVSTAILGLNKVGGFSGWQWLFLIEGAPTLLMAFVILAWLPDRPREAKWLTNEQKTWLEDTLASEAKKVESIHRVSFWRTFIDSRVLGLSFIYFANITTNLGVTFFLPQMVKSLGLSTTETGFVAAIPYVLGTIGTLAWGWYSDKFNERRISLFVALLISGLGLAAAGYCGNTFLGVAMISIAAVGIFGVKAPFWPLPSLFLTGSAAAGGIALINSVGNLGGFAGPYIMGWVKNATGNFNAGLYALAGLGFAAAAVTLMVVRPKSVT